MMVRIYFSMAQALGDGMLLDVTETAQETGNPYSTLLTRAVWDRYVRVPDDVTGQDEDGRLWDILWMLRTAVLRLGPDDDTNLLLFPVYVRNDNGHPQQVTLKSIIGPGDDPTEPVLIIMMPDEG